MVMIQVNVFEIKARLSEYLDRACRGERIVICRHNKPVAELRALENVRVDPRPIGPLPGRPTFEVPASFFEPMPEDELALWEGISPADPLAAPVPRREGGRTSKVAESRARYGKGARTRTPSRKRKA
jgi:antitoxin (DNA-binding transcriptional repressor) of toxin-antitoxin stability system